MGDTGNMNKSVRYTMQSVRIHVKDFTYLQNLQPRAQHYTGQNQDQG